MTGDSKKWNQLSGRQKRNRVLPFVVIVFLSLLGLVYTNFMRGQPQDYTIGTIVKIWKPVKGGKKVSFKYYVNGSEYTGNVNYSGFEQTAKPGKRFLVNYPEEYVWEGFMNLNEPIPDSLTAPTNGWDKRPIF